MKIKCPACNKNNQIEYAEHIKCSECGSSFNGFSFRKYKMPITVAVASGLIGFAANERVEAVWEDQRYPLSVEYELVNFCVNKSQSLMSNTWHVEKTKICICALERTMDDLTLSELEENESRFMTRLRSNIKSCN